MVLVARGAFYMNLRAQLYRKQRKFFFKFTNCFCWITVID
ncbi:Unknown protein sequence [Pseudomonas syringae pv. cilantro]|uniref:Uncharacterized protein n=1 Tax=Pseudomonas syringae pv. cilantro TaxID=81035 RepID=A0A0N0X906_PSESX|nr:Unknown protein sequence [Pseudomonas syringae pv. cilantro]